MITVGEALRVPGGVPSLFPLKGHAERLRR